MKEKSRHLKSRQGTNHRINSAVTQEESKSGVSNSNPVCVCTVTKLKLNIPTALMEPSNGKLTSCTVAAALVELQPSSISPALHPEVFTSSFSSLVLQFTQTLLYS